MTAKRFLNRARLLAAEIDAETSRRDQMAARLRRAAGVTLADGELPDSPQRRAVEGLSERVGARIVCLAGIQRDVERVIDLVERDDLRLLLTLRYLNALSWAKVAKRMRYDERQVYRLHGAALRAVERTLREEAGAGDTPDQDGAGAARGRVDRSV